MPASARERMALVMAERRIVKVGRLPHAVETLDPEDYDALAEAASVELRDALAGAETRLKVMLEAHAGYVNRIRELEAAVLDAGGQWVAGDRAPDTGIPELSTGFARDPMAEIERRLLALTEPPDPSVPAGVDATCDAVAPISRFRCDKSPRHFGWHRAGVCDESHRAHGRDRVWWAA